MCRKVHDWAASAFTMPAVTLKNVTIRDQSQLDYVLRALGVRVLKTYDSRDVFLFADLKENTILTPGASRKRWRQRPQRRKGFLGRPRSNKKICRKPADELGPLGVRASDHRHEKHARRLSSAASTAGSPSAAETSGTSATESDSEADARGPYKNTAYLRRHGLFVPISIDQRDLQRRFDRVHARQKTLEAAAAENKAAAADYKQDADRQRVASARVQSECDALRADIAALLVSDQDETGARQEVSFKDTNGEYDCDFEILMMEALNLASYSTAWPLVKASHEALTGKVITDEPVTSYLQDCFRRADVLADLQIAFALMEDPDAFISVLHDMTKKKGINLAGSQTRTSGADGRLYSLGVEAVPDATAVTALESCLRRLRWALEVYCQDTGTDCDADLRALIQKLYSSVSDRCPTEIKWVALLEEKKFAVIQEEYASMPEEEQKRKAYVYAFFCMAHCLSGTSQLAVEVPFMPCVPV